MMTKEEIEKLSPVARTLHERDIALEKEEGEFKKKQLGYYPSKAAPKRVKTETSKDELKESNNWTPNSEDF